MSSTNGESGVSDKNFDPAMKDTCELKEAWADGKKLYYVEDIPGLLEQITCLNKQLAKANEEITGLKLRIDNQRESLKKQYSRNDIAESELAKANERVEELQDALVDDAKAKAMLNKLAMENGELNIKASGNIFHVFCETFVETFKAAGATNYLVAEFNSEELGAFTVTMQRSEGLTVYQKLNEANERVKELEQENNILDTALIGAERSVEDEIKALNKFAIEKKIEFKNDLIKHLRNNYTWTHSVYEFIDSFGEQLRKEQE
jgi:predicted  nucleic acid-binding Zn-ribbon protein